MRLLAVSAVLAVALGACIESQAVRCSDGTLCGPGFRCAALDDQRETNSQEPPTCVLASCGDRIKDSPQEECDDGDGNAEAPNTCRPGCILPRCGDRIVDDAAPYNEVCEPGTSSDPDGTCSPDCRSTGKCGNGIVDRHLESPEECDDGNLRSGDGCSSRCKPEVLLWSPLMPRGLGNRYGHAMASDAERMVVFGGHDGDEVLGDTLENVGGRGWSVVELSTAMVPAPRWTHGMVWDTARGCFVMAGGVGSDGELLQDTWELDATGWRPVVTDAFPRLQQAVSQTPQPVRMAYDEARGVTVAIVSADDDSAPETWEYDGQQWYALDVETPEAKSSPVAFYGGVVQKVAMVALGADNTVHYFDGSSWQMSEHPYVGKDVPIAAQRRLAYHAGRDALLLSPSLALSAPISPYVFTHDGGWAPLLASEIPPTRSHGWAQHRPSNSVWLTGGRTSGAVYGHTWTVDVSSDWSEILDRATPDAAGAAAMGYDPLRDRLVAFGGDTDVVAAGGTWEFDGTQWTRRSIIGPTKRNDGALGWAGSRDSLVLVGGNVSRPIPDSQSFDGTSWVDDINAGPRGPNVSLFEDPVAGDLYAHQSLQAGSFSTDGAGLWRFDDPDWTAMSGPGGFLLRDRPASYGVDAARGVLLRLSFDDQDAPEWSAYDATTEEWQPLDLEVSATATRAMPSVWYPPCQSIVWFPPGELSPWSEVLFGDATRAASPVAVLGEGPRSFTRQLAYDARRRRIVAYTNEGLFGLEYTNTDAVESCVTPGDEDGDELADCADPDCNFDPACVGKSETDCGDGVDNDGDDDIDCADMNCGGLLCGDAHRCYAAACQPIVSPTE